MQKPTLRVSVKDLIEFVLQTGDLGGDGRFASPTRALEGTRAHQQIQRARPQGYQSEVPVRFELETDRFLLLVRGRIDGVLATSEQVQLEEIKSVSPPWNGQPDPLHWAQLKVYAHLFLEQTAFAHADLHLTYVELDSGTVTSFRQPASKQELARFFDEILSAYLEWLNAHADWIQSRDASIHQLTFPHKQYRPGQRALAVAAYRTLLRNGKLFAEAPTGIGKTISMLFPAIKALPRSRLQQLFYLTAKSVGRSVAQNTVAELRKSGLRLRTLTLTAKEKLCTQNGTPCDPQTCPLTLGYYDRVKAALRELLTHEDATRATLERIGQKHQVCPFALSLDAIPWVDLVIADYNYVFDPAVYLKRQFGDDPAECAFLVDEAHNLLERARDMFSAAIDTVPIEAVRSALGGALPGVAQTLIALQTEIRDHPLSPVIGTSQMEFSPALPDPILRAARRFLREAELWLARNEPAPFRPELLQLYFDTLQFARTADGFGDNYITIRETPETGGNTRLRLFCLDPSPLLQEALTRGRSAIFFSATLSPPEYFRELLGGKPEDRILRLTSPFPPENLAVLLLDRIRTEWRHRDRSCDAVAYSIGSLVGARQGNYLVYFPSYAYLDAVASRFEQLYPHIRTLRQTPGMTDPERDAFIAAFHDEPAETLVGFAVMGGLFGEGIDLAGERLVGAVVVGVGLPQISPERDRIRDYFEQRKGTGYDYAYTYPGWIRVLQAVGRVIRSETDRGIVLLIDARFHQKRYRDLFPPWWHPRRAADPDHVAALARQFWSDPHH